MLLPFWSDAASGARRGLGIGKQSILRNIVSRLHEFQNSSFHKSEPLEVKQALALARRTTPLIPRIWRVLLELVLRC